MGAPSSSNQQNSITQQNLALSAEQEARSQKQYEQMQQLEAPAIAFNQGIAGGDNSKTFQAAAPLISNITSGYNAAKESIMNNTTPGAARDYALTQLPIQQNSQIANTLNTTFTSALDKLSNIGAGLGSFSLQETGAALGGLSGASSSNQAVMQAQEAGKASTMGVLGSLLGAGGQIASMGVLKSDRNLKRNIREMFEVLPAVLDIPVVRFEYRNLPGQPHVGVIAQDVLPHFPEMVGFAGGYHTVDYGQLAALSLRAVQELAAQVAELRVELAEAKRCLTTA